MWDQIYDPLHSKVLSTIAAAIPVVTLLILIATNKVKAHIAAIIALIVANLVAILIFWPESVTYWIVDQPALDPAALERALEDIPMPEIDELVPDLGEPPPLDLD